jgi:L-galactose dehydrogenase
MEYRKLGNTGLEISIIGFGASPLGNVFRTASPEEGINAVHLAIDRGINFFDVSPYYGLTLAEERLGIALEGKRDKIILATKCGRYGGDTFDFSAKRIFASIDESLTRLRTDHVDLFQAHDIEFVNLQQIIDEAVPAMRKVVEQGKARFVGITGYPLKALRHVAEAVPVDSILSYCRYNLMITDMDTVLTPFCKAHGIGLINASGLHMGIITERGAPDWHPAPAAVKEAGKRIIEICKAHGADASEVALRYCFDHPGVASTLVGMSSPEHVERNLKVLNTVNDPALIAEIEAAVAPVKDAIWPSGLPENND